MEIKLYINTPCDFHEKSVIVSQYDNGPITRALGAIADELKATEPGRYLYKQVADGIAVYWGGCETGVALIGIIKPAYPNAKNINALKNLMFVK